MPARVLLKSGPGNRGRSACGPTHVARLEFPRVGIFWFHLTEISFDACLLQMWLIHAFKATESGVLLAMALDRYVAICNPLRHASIFSPKLLTHIGVGVTLRAAILGAPCLVLIKYRLKFYRTTVVSHSYCEHMAIVKLAIEDIRINKIYGASS